MTTMDKAVKEYMKRGVPHYMVKMYGGIDPYTKKQIDITKRGFKTKTEAKAFYAQKQAEMLQRNDTDNPNLTFEQFYHSYYEKYLQNCSLEKSTLGKIKGIFKNHILPFYGDLKLKNISYQDTLQSFELWKEKLQKPSKVAIELNKCLEQAVYNDFIPKNPVKLDGLRLWEKKEEKKRDNAQDDKLLYISDEIDVFIQKLKTTDDISKIAIFLVFVNLGLRKGELLALQWQDIDFQNKKIRIHQAVGMDESNKPYIKSTKNLRERTLDIDEETFQALLKWQELQEEQLKWQNLEHQGDKQFIFPNNKNTFYISSKLNTWLKKFQTQHGLKLVSVHGLRHSCATRIYYQTKDIKFIQHFLGHTDITTTTDTYIHCIPELSSLLVKRFNRTA
ncbi:tyrosine-type recombinase/integrase [Lysinibacillus sp. Bpr_S20]|uniref:tyrosine-type recombinase/integrase n=1 Tax=Lysinibacillus sp. Bpr_S20 TaxID=2933964 RepID=UPI002012F998|nr:tyrosine-type recombinase/integrase [Lysinibacillus sp. Bpr_S20]MCL1702207.1 site-specific integrase [Lysinibacillus sp. Bpr_S20]